MKKGIRLNSSCSNDNENDNEKGDKETVTNLILEEIEGVITQFRVKLRPSIVTSTTYDYSDTGKSGNNEYKGSDIIIKRITSNLLLKGGMGQKFFLRDTDLTSEHYESDYLDILNKRYKNRKKELGLVDIKK